MERQELLFIFEAVIVFFSELDDTCLVQTLSHTSTANSMLGGMYSHVRNINEASELQFANERANTTQQFMWLVRLPTPVKEI